ncbi:MULTISPECIES: ornithine cyclodeaminase family protein [unclassified Curtobacterium]|uniref:ornithine cyclodeaminase family protein n=1 Tax=unclassified Curtobacterium TaxID=257496 RepID=UPI000F4AF379|nr:MULTISPECIES: ornithine cyclodeaminase family protein [unclassified Curtobacterium]ROQ17784.1 ornithine cyclodeaminase/alanine dehydrogenase [Curtobacterium sp. PhB171]ROQ28971.1 ornithine cyclodeaminase/alanine dehydrogenase [Curtobacterium sp. PhB170]ROS45885.1 ornithine cyclodeaminase/alanine dehydrogenase [Curtobacterium sp. PhB131]ROS67813.1 ornithine cyclodeaminase/alanine dehydrogenase [Curtobacterium sp. PhB141]
MTVVLGAADVAGLIDAVDVVGAVEAVHADLGTGAMQQPAPVALTGADDALFLPMAVRSDRLGLVAVKLMADIPDNSARGLPSQRSTILVSSSVTGECVAVLDGMTITRARTAATTVVATKHLARSGSRTLGILGAGNLAVEHVRAFEATRPFERIVLWSRSSGTVTRFLEAVGPDVARRCMVVPEVRRVVEEADVLCTLTPSVDPIVRGAWLHAGQHVNAVGARPRPTHRELDGAAMARGTLFVDSRATAWTKSGDLLEAVVEGAVPQDLHPAELGEVVAGRAPGRTGDDEITVFDSVGLGAQDLAVAARLIDLARERGVGTQVSVARVGVPVPGV